MFFEVLLFLILGILVGTLTGLVPGLHPNTVFVLSVAAASFFVEAYPLASLVFVVSLAVSNTFTDFLPSIIFGAPEPESALSVLPGHQYLLEGRGYEALYLTVVGGVFSTIFMVALMPLILLAIPIIYSVLRPGMHILLSLIVVWMIIGESGIGRLYALLVFMLSGALGFIVLNSQFSSSSIMFPIFSGLFGISTMLVSFMRKTRIPPQDVRIQKAGFLKGSVAGWLSGMLAGLLPGIGSAQAGIITAQAFKSKTRDFLISLGGINTSNIIFTFLVFYTIGKTRSGAVWAVSMLFETISQSQILLMVSVALTTCFVAALITLFIGRLSINRIAGIDYNRITAAIILFLVLSIFIITGPVGLLITATGTCIGLLTIFFRVKRTHLMGVLIFPTILYFAGLTAI